MDQQVNCSNKKNMSKHLFVSQFEKVCQTLEQRHTMFRSHKQRSSETVTYGDNSLQITTHSKVLMIWFLSLTGMFYCLEIKIYNII